MKKSLGILFIPSMCGLYLYLYLFTIHMQAVSQKTFIFHLQLYIKCPSKTHTDTQSFILYVRIEKQIRCRLLHVIKSLMMSYKCFILIHSECPRFHWYRLGDIYLVILVCGLRVYGIRPGVNPHTPLFRHVKWIYFLLIVLPVFCNLKIWSKITQNKNYYMYINCICAEIFYSYTNRILKERDLTNPLFIYQLTLHYFDQRSIAQVNKHSESIA